MNKLVTRHCRADLRTCGTSSPVRNSYYEPLARRTKSSNPERILTRSSPRAMRSADDAVAEDDPSHKHLTNWPSRSVPATSPDLPAPDLNATHSAEIVIAT